MKMAQRPRVFEIFSAKKLPKRLDGEHLREDVLQPRPARDGLMERQGVLGRERHHHGNFELPEDRGVLEQLNEPMRESRPAPVMSISSAGLIISLCIGAQF